MLHLYSSSGQLFHAIIRLLLLVLLLAVLFRPAQLSHLTLSLASSSVTLNLCTSFLTVCCGPPRFLLSHSCIFSILWPVYPLSLPCLPTVAQFPPLTCKPTAPEAVVVNLGSNQSNVEMSFFMIRTGHCFTPLLAQPFPFIRA